jgi:hypothetical protein
VTPLATWRLYSHFCGARNADGDLVLDIETYVEIMTPSAIGDGLSLIRGAAHRRTGRDGGSGRVKRTSCGLQTL